MTDASNAQIASRLEEIARLLSEQGANEYRVAAYRHAARTLRQCPRAAAEIVRAEGATGLRRLPGIGASLAATIAGIATSGRAPMLERLRGASDPQALLASVPGIGAKLAARLHRELGIETLADLEAAAHDGRLADLAGFGEKRIAGIRDSLAGRLARVRPPEPDAADPARPSVAEILDVDREYRERAAAGTLPRIAPRRFNPGRDAWLPILHTTRGRRHYTALFSNTAHAHEVGKTHDWVVLYYDGPAGEGQCTVITATRGPHAGLRIVRGREDDVPVTRGVGT